MQNSLIWKIIHKEGFLKRKKNAKNSSPHMSKSQVKKDLFFSNPSTKMKGKIFIFKLIFFETETQTK